jgi:membrane-bound lytic murein transglycosylase D
LANYAAIPAEQKIKWERHLVQKGETLAVLAKKYNTTPDALRDINGIKKDRVIPGKHILIPLDLNSKTQNLNYLAINQGSKLQDILYRVRRGETLSVIARNHNVTIADIREWNKGLGKSVRAGQKIKLIVDADQI